MDPAERLASKQNRSRQVNSSRRTNTSLGSIPSKIITAVKEAVDNSLDACEESRILQRLE